MPVITYYVKNSSKLLHAVIIMNRIEILKLICIPFLFIACTSLKKVSTDTNDDVTNSSWLYIDKDWQYEIQFKKNGQLITTHPNDNTKGNDTWVQNGKQINFYYNDKFAIYKSQLISPDTIQGKGMSKKGNWEFSMYRKK